MYVRGQFQDAIMLFELNSFLICSMLDVFIPAPACQQNIACNEYQQWGFCRTLGGTITLTEKSIFSSNTSTWNEESQTLTKLHLVLAWKNQCSDACEGKNLR